MIYQKSLIIVLFFLIVPFVHAQNDSSRAKIRLNSEMGNARAFEFFVLNHFGVSFKQCLTSTAVIRYNFTMSFSAENGDDNFGANKNDKQFLNLSSQYVIFPLLYQSARIFLGAGPLFEFNRRYNFHQIFSSQNTPGSPPPPDHSEETYSSLGLGIGGISGIECFVSKEISLLAQYNIFIMYNWSKNERLIKDAQGNLEQNRISYGYFWSGDLSSVQIGIAYYF